MWKLWNTVVRKVWNKLASPSKREHERRTHERIAWMALVWTSLTNPCTRQTDVFAVHSFTSARASCMPKRLCCSTSVTSKASENWQANRDLTEGSCCSWNLSKTVTTNSRHFPTSSSPNESITPAHFSIPSAIVVCFCDALKNRKKHLWRLLKNGDPAFHSSLKWTHHLSSNPWKIKLSMTLKLEDRVPKIATEVLMRCRKVSLQIGSFTKAVRATKHSRTD